ncbi:MAG TPA: Npt1/Npt2 family nucleotide transporter [Steroidobacteraceae bacterium]|nr:Npt1/Npt2 family nucleotide transporter [Steroidobacteraceae bacterium]
MAQANEPSGFARFFKSLAGVEPLELRPTLVSFVCFFFLFFSYAVVKPVRDAMGTVWGARHLPSLFLATFLLSFAVAPLYALLSARVKLSAFLPWIYGIIAASVLGFFFLFSGGHYQERWLAAGFFVWVSTFNLLILSVFWSFMADLFSRVQAKRLFGFIAAGGTAGNILGPAIVDFLAKRVGNDGLMLISAAGFAFTAVLVILLAGEKRRLLAASPDAQRTTLDHRLSPNPFEGFALLMRSRYLLLVALFLFVMTSVSTIVYVQLNDIITHSFANRAARTQAFATIDLAVNSLTVLIQLFGTGRIIQRFGVTAGLLLNPLIMALAFIVVIFSPVLMILGGVQVVRRVAEYAVAKPAREMLFTVVDQESKYKAKNVIDTVVYRGGDLLAAYASAAVLAFGLSGLAVLGVVVAAIWFPIAYALGRRYENFRGTDAATRAPTPAAG